jgi:hypothetical protein
LRTTVQTPLTTRPGPADPRLSGTWTNGAGDVRTYPPAHESLPWTLPAHPGVLGPHPIEVAPILIADHEPEPLPIPTTDRAKWLSSPLPCWLPFNPPKTVRRAVAVLAARVRDAHARYTSNAVTAFFTTDASPSRRGVSGSQSGQATSGRSVRATPDTPGRVNHTKGSPRPAEQRREA